MTNTKVANELESVELSAGTLTELLTGALTHSHKDKALPALSSVQLSASDGQLIARATDRYRLVEAKASYTGDTLSASLILADDVKRIIALTKSAKFGNASITRAGDMLSVSIAGGNVVTINLWDANYPNFDDLFNKFEASSLDRVTFNPAYMADLAKIAGKGNSVTIDLADTKRPMKWQITGDAIQWRGLIMPMKAAN